MITTQQLQQILPNAGARAQRFAAPLSAAMAEFEINTPARAAAFVAQLAHESGEFLYMEELADGSAYEWRRDLGNLEQAAIDVAHRNGSTSGKWFKGHGPIEITGYYNHKRCGDYLRVDLVEHPRALTEPEIGCRSAGWFWHLEKNLNPLADVGDFITITKRINGGLNGLADRRRYWELAKRGLCYGAAS